jgi:hypothetical protein
MVLFIIISYFGVLNCSLQLLVIVYLHNFIKFLGVQKFKRFDDSDALDQVKKSRIFKAKNGS